VLQAKLDTSPSQVSSDAPQSSPAQPQELAAGAPGAAPIPESELRNISLSDPAPMPAPPEKSPPVAISAAVPPPPSVEPEPIISQLGATEPAVPPPEEARPPIIHVDRTKLAYRTPKSTQGANNAALTKALLASVRGHKSAIVETLLDRGVSPDTGADENAIITATMNSDLPTLALLLAFGGNPDSVGGDGHPAIIHGAWGRYDPAKLLLEWGADPNFDADEWTPLPWALNDDKLEMVKLMMLYGADPNHAGTNGETPLVYACKKDMAAPVVEAMLLYKPDVNMKNREGYTPLEASCVCTRPSLTGLFLKYGADPNLEGLGLPVVGAVKNAECLSLLLQHHVSVPKDEHSGQCYSSSQWGVGQAAN
jgi:ankyrin repeat protein